MSFIHGALLAYGIPAVSIPILIHLLNKRRFRKMRWAAMEFLLKARMQNRRKIQLENWLLLLLRALLVLLILLLVSRPIVSDKALSLVPGIGESVERIVVLDDSASLTDKIGGQSSFDRAKTALNDFCQQLAETRSGDSLTIIRSSRPSVPDAVRLAPRSQPLTSLLNSLKSWQATDLPADLPTAAQTIVSGAAANSDRHQRRVLYMLSDLRRTDWIGANGAKASQLAEQLREFQRQQHEALPVFVVDVSMPPAENLAVTQFETLDRVIATNVPVRFAATIQNFGTTTANNIQLILKVAESAVPVATISSLSAGEAKRLQLPYTFREPGNTSLTLQMVGLNAGSNRLTRDDRRFLAVNVLETIRVLAIDGEPPTAEHDAEHDSEVFSLMTALAPAGDTISGITVKKIRGEEILDEDLSQFELVMIANLEIWPAERLTALENFVKRGGGLAIFVGDQVDTERYMRDFWKNGQGLLPVPLGSPLGSGSDEKAVGLQVTESRHALLRNFVGIENQLLRRVAVWRYLSVPEDQSLLSSSNEKEANLAPKVIACYDDQAKTPALVEKTFGLGHVLLFNSSADAEWGNWPRQIAFVPILQEAVRFLAPSASGQKNLSAGEELSRQLSLARFEARAFFEGPQTQNGPVPIFAQPQPNSALQVLRINDTSLSGHYSLKLTSRLGTNSEPEVTEFFAVNLTPRESDLRRVNSEDLARSLPEVTIRTSAFAQSKKLLDVSEGQRQETWRMILFAFLFLLICEGLLGLRAGHHTSAIDNEDMARLKELRN